MIFVCLLFMSDMFSSPVYNMILQHISTTSAIRPRTNSIAWFIIGVKVIWIHILTQRALDILFRLDVVNDDVWWVILYHFFIPRFTHSLNAFVKSLHQQRFRIYLKLLPINFGGRLFTMCFMVCEHTRYTHLFSNCFVCSSCFTRLWTSLSFLSNLNGGM